MSFIRWLLGAALGIVFLLTVAVLASIALGVALAGGIVAWIWLAWRSRSLPRRRIIEGEYRDVTNLERLDDRGGERL